VVRGGKVQRVHPNGNLASGTHIQRAWPWVQAMMQVQQDEDWNDDDPEMIAP
jgi:hypothetical protein